MPKFIQRGQLVIDEIDVDDFHAELVPCPVLVIVPFIPLPRST
jgi:hypothetical protein